MAIPKKQPQHGAKVADNWAGALLQFYRTAKKKKKTKKKTAQQYFTLTDHRMTYNTIKRTKRAMIQQCYGSTD